MECKIKTLLDAAQGLVEDEAIFIGCRTDKALDERIRRELRLPQDGEPLAQSLILAADAPGESFFISEANKIAFISERRIGNDNITGIIVAVREKNNPRMWDMFFYQKK